MFVLNLATFIAVFWYACTTRSMWKEMHVQTETAQKQLEQTVRPWIKIVDVKTHGNNPLGPALSFQGFGYGFFPNGNKQITFQLQIALKNIGHSVAMADADYELFLARWSNNHFADETVGEEKRFCNSRANVEPAVMTRSVVFPDEPFEKSGATSALVTDDKVNHDIPESSGDVVVPVAIVCINYTLADSPKVYQTRAMYEIFRSDNRTRFFDVGRGVPASQIFMIRDSYGDDAY